VNTTIAKIVALSVALLACGLICVVGVRAEQKSVTSSASNLTTNWVGYLVAGQGDALDQISPGPSPTVLHQVEIGLRSDGVVVWRKAHRQ
jgi:hypothetical protein